MILRCLSPLALSFNGMTVRFETGHVFTVTTAQGARVLARFPGKVEGLTLPPDLPEEPLQPGWLVAYRDRAGVLRGGCDDRVHGTVRACTWDGSTWMVILTEGQRPPLTDVLSVGKTDPQGTVLAAWTTRQHGYDGEGRRG